MLESDVFFHVHSYLYSYLVVYEYLVQNCRQ